MAELTDPEFSRPVRLDTLGDGVRHIAIEANADERMALARRFGLLAIERMDAEADLHNTNGAVHASGRLRAAVTQACVASGEPIAAIVDEPFELKFMPEGSATEDEIELDEDDLDIIGFAGGAIDLGEAAAQTLSLALDPFPRAPNAAQVLREAGVVDEQDVGPFAVLKGLKDKL
ncbi:YceD family protein [Sphingomonas sp. MMS24-J13]|uniref:YceD family protein n=1 Tax=Sphingomonas sp. MMS24-J13 TaxID=3238686 RepID=UPI00384EECB5